MSKPTKEEIAAAVDRYGCAMAEAAYRSSGLSWLMKCHADHTANKAKAELDAMLDAALAPPATTSDLRRKIEAAAEKRIQAHCTWGVSASFPEEADAEFSTLLDAVDRLAKPEPRPLVDANGNPTAEVYAIIAGIFQMTPRQRGSLLAFHAGNSSRFGDDPVSMAIGAAVAAFGDNAFCVRDWNLCKDIARVVAALAGYARGDSQ